MNDVTPGRSLAEIKQRTLIVRDESVFLDTGKFEQMQRYATLMSTAKLVPQHLQGSVGDCFMVCQQADRWKMDPFAVAQKTHIVQGKLGYEAQLVAAVINSRAPLSARLNVRFEGEGADLVCIAFATMEGESEPREKRSPRISDITTKNSPLWKVDPPQQLAYWTQRAWARLHCPDVLLGVYTADELESAMDFRAGSDGAYTMLDRPTIASANALTPAAQERHHEGAADEPENKQPYALVDESGVEYTRCATPDQWAKELKAASAPVEGKLTAKAQAILLNNLEAYQALKDEIADDAAVTALDKRYTAIAKAAKKEAPPPAPAIETPKPIDMPMKDGKVKIAEYYGLVDKAITAAMTKEAVVGIFAIEKDNFAKILPGQRRALKDAGTRRWIVLGGEQDAFAPALEKATG